MGPSANKRHQRCSNKGFLPMSTADYLSLLDSTARQERSGKRYKHETPAREFSGGC
jgi:hypothetical protein